MPASERKIDLGGLAIERRGYFEQVPPFLFTKGCIGKLSRLGCLATKLRAAASAGSDRFFHDDFPKSGGS